MGNEAISSRKWFQTGFITEALRIESRKDEGVKELTKIKLIKQRKYLNDRKGNIFSLILEIFKISYLTLNEKNKGLERKSLAWVKQWLIEKLKNLIYL